MTKGFTYRCIQAFSALLITGPTLKGDDRALIYRPVVDQITIAPDILLSSLFN